MADPRSDKRDLVLPPGTYAFIQDQTTGSLKMCTGPNTITPSQSDVPVVFDAATNQFKRCDVLDLAVCPNAFAPEGSYIVLKNPAKNGQPKAGLKGSTAEYDLRIGSRSVIPGPIDFPLWPQQSAEAIQGHHLRSNQYLKIRVYNEEEAKANWGKAVMKPSTPALDAEGKPLPAPPVTTKAPPSDITIGKQLIIKGTEVSFYIPPPGIEVLQNDDPEADDHYVHDALTLERLEYCILIDEGGKKRYEQGPAVVFPTPTEQFITTIEQVRGASVTLKKFRAVELNEIQGIHVKVIADYEDGEVKHKAGQELFITGKETAIYYPREEHSAIKYDGKVKSFATAVPAGEARYVLNRTNGQISKTVGPAMLLPDPRTEVIVRRVLSDKQCTLWYPNNMEALTYNQQIRVLQAGSPTTRSGSVSEGEIERGMKGAARSASERNRMLVGDADVKGLATNRIAASSTMSFMESSNVSKEQGLVGDEFSRGSTYTAPRTITLDTKYQGAPVIDIWPGYAVLVVSKDPNAPIRRRVVKGPETILLDYHEVLEVLSFSTGKPKTTDALEKSVYLRVEHNKVSDKVTVETFDHVSVELYLSYKVNFRGEPMLWFTVENYVKYLCDHARSILKGATRKIKIEDFYTASTDIIRDILLGKQTENKTRPGLSFPENGMQMDDLEVLGVTITDPSIQTLLVEAQRSTVRVNVELANLARGLEVTKKKEAIVQEETQVRAATQKSKAEVDMMLAEAALSLALAKFGNRMKELGQEKLIITESEQLLDIKAGATLVREKAEKEQNLALNKAAQELTIVKLKADVDAVVERFKAAQGGFSEALLALSNNETLTKVAESWSIQRIIGGDSVSDALAKVFTGSPVEALMKKMLTNGQQGSAPGQLPVPPPPPRG